jgi:hypothetical protein
LLKALADSHPDCEVWLQSYQEDIEGINMMNTHPKLTLSEYCALHEKGTPEAIPSMCVLTIKRDEHLLLL